MVTDFVAVFPSSASEGGVDVDEMFGVGMSTTSSLIRTEDCGVANETVLNAGDGGATAATAAAAATVLEWLTEEVDCGFLLISFDDSLSALEIAVLVAEALVVVVAVSLAPMVPVLALAERESFVKCDAGATAPPVLVADPTLAIASALLNLMISFLVKPLLKEHFRAFVTHAEQGLNCR